MARAHRDLARNAPGDLFVDESCIACDTCRRFAPETFGGDEDEVAFVQRQPSDPDQRRRALLALVSCPVAAIGSRSKVGVAEAAAALPEEIAPGLFDCGYAARSSFGAAAWLVQTAAGNVLVDSPRFTAPLLKRLVELGGVRWMFLTHRDDVADHARWHSALGCDRVLHARDVTGGTRSVEVKVQGDDPFALADELLVVPVPGHTAGSSALLVRDTLLFTGDHLWANAAGQLEASRAVCWWDWDAQVRSMARLADLEFEWVLPGHGRPWRAPSRSAARAAVRALAESMR